MKSTVTEFLRACTYNMFKYESNDVTEHTVEKLTSDVKNSIRINAAIFDDVDNSNEKIIANNTIELVKSKVEYYKRIRMEKNIQRNEFNVNYDFKSIQIEGNYAKAEVYEAISFYYTGLDDITYLGYNYIVYLYRNNGDWYVANVISDDALDAYVASGVSVEKEVSISEVVISATPSPITCEVSAMEATGGDRGNVTSYRYYDGANAAKYAYTYCTSTSTSQSGAEAYYNANFNYSWGALDADCQNFASQCVWAGLAGDNTRSAVLNDKIPADPTGTNKWIPIPASVWSWTECGAFRSYVSAAAASLETEMVASIYNVPGNQYSMLGSGYTANKLLGSILHVRGIDSNNQPDAYGHAIIVTNVIGTNPDRDDIYYCAHSNNAKNVCLGDVYPAGTTNSELTAIKIIIPSYYRYATTCPLNMHSYTNLYDATCNSCGYNRMYIDSVLHNPVAVNTQLQLSSEIMNAYASSASVQVTTPSGSTQIIATATNAMSISCNYTFAQLGLYTLKVTALDSSNASVEQTYTVRTYQP